MNIWVVYYVNWESFHIEKAFDNKEKARKYVDSKPDGGEDDEGNQLYQIEELAVE